MDTGSERLGVAVRPVPTSTLSLNNASESTRVVDAKTCSEWRVSWSGLPFDVSGQEGCAGPLPLTEQHRRVRNGGYPTRCGELATDHTTDTPSEVPDFVIQREEGITINPPKIRDTYMRC